MLLYHAVGGKTSHCGAGLDAVTVSVGSTRVGRETEVGMKIKNCYREFQVNIRSRRIFQRAGTQLRYPHISSTIPLFEQAPTHWLEIRLLLLAFPSWRIAHSGTQGNAKLRVMGLSNSIGLPSRTSGLKRHWRTAAAAAGASSESPVTGTSCSTEPSLPTITFRTTEP
jgi:hypothetical protein